MADRTDAILDRLCDLGILPCAPTYVRRFYKDGGRLGLSARPGGTYLPKVRLWRPERWIASTVQAANPSPIPGEGISRLAVRGTAITLPDALERRGERILGRERWAAYGADFPVLIKILDPAEPIILHFHARDEDVWRHPEHFHGHRFGKDEAYYFLDAPKGAEPYTHAGLYPGVTRHALAEAMAGGRDRLLELSPAIYQRIGEGLFVPAGVPHRPGTALTLEVQQPSDVYTLLEPISSGGRRLSPRQMHPGFASLHDALGFIDYAAACDPALLEHNRLQPEPVEGAGTRGGEEAWIFPPRLRKFSGKRLLVRTRFVSLESGPYVALVWRGSGRLLGRPLRPGSEVLVTAEAAVRPHVYDADRAPLEVFKLFPPPALTPPPPHPR